MRINSSGVGTASAVCLIQLAIAVAACSVAAVYGGKEQATAALYGGAVALMPTLYMLWRLYLSRSAQTPIEIAGAFYRGEIGKFALTAVMFGFGVKFFASHYLALLVTYMACLLAYWLMLGIASGAAPKTSLTK